MRIVRYNYPRSVGRLAGFGSPWAGLESEIDRMMSNAFSNTFAEDAESTALGQPRVDLYEDKDNFHFRADLPGLKKEDIHVEVGDGVLTVSGTRRAFAANGEAEETTKFSRSLSLPAPVKDEKIAANYQDGVLAIALPKAEEVKPKKIAIQVK
jgi:HSP20 family protein